MLHRTLIILFIFSLSWTGLSQDPDSITVIPMATNESDTIQPRKKAAGTARIRRPDNFWRRVAIGGNIGFQFGTVTGFNISPEVRIRTVDQLYVGVGFVYQYFRFSDYFWDTLDSTFVSYTSNTYGGRIYLRYYLKSLFDGWAGNFFVHTEYEYLHYVIPFKLDTNGRYVDVYDYSQQTYSKGKELIDIHSVFVGGGYTQPISNRVFVDFLIMFNLNDNPYSPYSNPVFRLGVGVGL
ncbi:MAG: hypothetical protein HQ542_03890 [Bacteroidia bacterium]|nr:hypothetical protein [Bacteroidia bacterium]